ncbi:transporter [Rhodobacter sphaeroides]|jgi:Protein involved in meta-pathway of phenol degradation|uniref:Phenol degradation enzyme n=1 Tax=Cereibacter sphaeroides (strain ATCC 17023 / DSM 158 / JCM 6121 / CCUG 31486 / LMG 2827 / NBRC 12203 / NCIMB 8253 / ATH 2.4.1.) TaxID=272943 RepID=Q3IXV3_CERS4|nr:transporter [Cereibacter sphaeroides]ABA80631.1 putative phenol degradation enzyme [Cereibacter sphaeroides 2.4.1]AMJ48961.1 peptidase [Cereibacter sphaeroides]ANS35677.1 peptidase [Cereibacter sphaeroides]ATN64730.1 peptidase [Cereibacter sphaeroides]AXC62924.1 transporter [Cereibacter sphaeroides 2.4.1]
MTTTRILGLAALALSLAAPARAIDVGPADYTILPGGTTLGMVYWQHLSSDTLRLDGAEVPGSSFEANIGILRTLSYFDMGETPAVFHVVAPFAGLDADIGGVGQRTSDGLGDLTLGLTVWPVQPDSPETGTTLGLSLFATLPTGDYDPARMGLGEGTWTITPQIGLIQGLGHGFYFDGALDVALQRDHDEDGMNHERTPSWQLQAMLRKQWGSTTSLAVGYSGQRGGAQSIGGTETGLKTHRDQLRIYGSHFVTPTVQVQGMYGRDLKVEGGFDYDSVAQIRIVKVF